MSFKKSIKLELFKIRKKKKKFITLIYSNTGKKIIKSLKNHEIVKQNVAYREEIIDCPLLTPLIVAYIYSNTTQIIHRPHKQQIYTIPHFS